MYRLERRGILIQDGVLNSNSSLVIANAASESLTASHDEIRREVEAKLSWGFLRYFRRGAVIGILSGSIALILNSAIGSKLYDILLDILKKALGTPTPSIPTTIIPSGEDITGGFPSLDFILKAIEEGFFWFF